MKNVVLKSVLGIVAASSFAFAFGQEKITQYIPFTNTTIDTTCLNQFYREEPPVIVKESLNKKTYPLCFNGFNAMYSGVSKTPLWTAEYLSVARLSQKIKRENSFHEEMRVDASDRATLADYRASGYDRGHMSPNADMPTKESQFDSFSLANMIPQAPKNNQQVWRELEEAVRAIVTKQKQDVYIVTGPVFSGKKLKTIGNGVMVPTAVFKAVYLPSKGIIGAYYAPNDDSLQVKVISVCQLEEVIGMNIFPQLTTDQKRNTYNLPLNSTQVKANKVIEYAQWDGESQCAEDISNDQIQVLQKQFSQSGRGMQTATTTKISSSKETVNVPQDEQQSNAAEQLTQDILEKILSAIWQYFLQLLK